MKRECIYISEFLLSETWFEHQWSSNGLFKDGGKERPSILVPPCTAGLCLWATFPNKNRASGISLSGIKPLFFHLQNL